MILVDTSAWVEYDRATGSAIDLRLTDLVETSAAIAVTEPVIMEVLAEARTDAREADLRRLLSRFELLHFDAAIDFDGAVQIYRRCRAAGVTPRGMIDCMIDCMIASVALRANASLLCHDRGLTQVAQVIGIALDEGTAT